jgi:hypothetical protein
MNLLFWVLIFSFTLISCSPEPKTAEFSDDYALIEFAAKLEEETTAKSANSTQPLDKNPYTQSE